MTKREVARFLATFGKALQPEASKAAEVVLALGAQLTAEANAEEVEAAEREARRDASAGVIAPDEVAAAVAEVEARHAEEAKAAEPFAEVADAEATK